MTIFEYYDLVRTMLIVVLVLSSRRDSSVCRTLRGTMEKALRKLISTSTTLLQVDRTLTRTPPDPWLTPRRGTQTHSYMKYLYKYPQKPFPYEDLVKENAKRNRQDKEYQLIDTGIFEEDRYWDIFIETAKEDDDPDELLFRVTAWNRGPDPAPLHIIPQVWFRNTWAWGREPEENKPSIGVYAENMAKSKHHTLGERYILLSPSPGAGPSGEDVQPEMLFTDNDTNYKTLYDRKNEQPYVKDAFHHYIVDGEKDAVNPAKTGTKCAALFSFNEAGGVNPGECAGT